jgi:hypothetical protein
MGKLREQRRGQPQLTRVSDWSSWLDERSHRVKDKDGEDCESSKTVKGKDVDPGPLVRMLHHESRYGSQYDQDDQTLNFI